MLLLLSSTKPQEFNLTSRFCCRCFQSFLRALQFDRQSKGIQKLVDDQKTALARKATELRTARADLQKAKKANAKLEVAHAAKVKLLEVDLAKAKETASNWEEIGSNLINSSSDYA